MGGLEHAALNGFEWTIQPDADAALGKQIEIHGLYERAATHRHYSRFTALDAADAGADGFGLNPAELLLAAFFENCGNRIAPQRKTPSSLHVIGMTVRKRPFWEAMKVMLSRLHNLLSAT